MAEIYYETDADLGLLKGKTVAILGYGSQGHAHALNLRDSGVSVVVGLHEGSSSRQKAEDDGLEVGAVDEAAEKSDIVMMLVPDTSQAEIYKRSVAKHMGDGRTLMFAHGFNIHYETIVPPGDVDVSMIAPKSPGHRLRELYVKGVGVPALVAIHQDASGKAKEMALAYAKGIGSTRAGVLETTFQEETETDLFGEQTVLCGGVTSLVKAGFEILIEAGYQPEIAYFEVLHELKLIVDLMYQGGMDYMRYSVSDTAEYGDYTRGPRVVDEDVKENMRSVLKDIQDGTFAREWIAENDEGRPRFNRLKKENTGHPVEKVGRILRQQMPWLKDTV